MFFSFKSGFTAILKYSSSKAKLLTLQSFPFTVSAKKKAPGGKVPNLKKIQGDKKVKRNPKINEMIDNLAQEVTTLNSSDRKTQIEMMRPHDVYKMMDSSIDGFFFKREYNLKNFNFLLQVLSEQKNFEASMSTLEKMKELGIKPNSNTYNFLIKTCAKTNRIEEAVNFFEIAKTEVGPNLHIYNSLMLAYARKHQPEQCLMIFNELKDAGMTPDQVCYTTLINAYYKKGDLATCWKFYDEATSTVAGEIDPTMNGLMIEICAHTGEAEKALSFFDDIENVEFKRSCLPYNALIKALGSRFDYADRAIETFFKMKTEGISPDVDTYVHTLKACASIGDVKTAYELLYMMKDQGLKMNKYIYNQIIRVYAGAVALDNLKEETKELYVMDAWKIFDQAKQANCVNIYTLNSLLLVHTNALKIKELDGLVLPLFSQFGIVLNSQTYENLLVLFKKTNDFDKVFKFYDDLSAKGLEPTSLTLNSYLEAVMKIQDIDRIVQVLRDFKKFKKEPKDILLKSLGEAEDLPDAIYLELIDFSKKYGFVKDNVYRVKKPNKFSPM